MPGVDPVTFPTDYRVAVGMTANQLAVAPRLSEPELRPCTLANSHAE